MIDTYFYRPGKSYAGANFLWLFSVYIQHVLRKNALTRLLPAKPRARISQANLLWLFKRYSHA